MFGFNIGRRRRHRGFGGGNPNLRNAALLGAGVLAYRWFRNRQSSNKAGAGAGSSTEFSGSERSSGF